MPNFRKIRQIPKTFKPEPIPNYAAVNYSNMFKKFKVLKQNWMTCDGFPKQI